MTGPLTQDDGSLPKGGQAMVEAREARSVSSCCDAA